MARKSSKTRPVTSYLSSAKNNGTLVPSLKKYRRRKTLSAAEKAAITRAENHVKTASRGGELLALSKAEAARLKDKDALVGNGIRAVRMRGARGAKVTVKKDGQLTLKRGSRQWFFEGQPPDPATLATRIGDIFSNATGEVFLTVWTAAGRLPQTFPEVGPAIDFVTAFVEQYQSLDPDFEEWFLGIAWFEQ